MAAQYDQLLDAAIRCLEQLKAQGVRYIPASSAALSALASAPPSPTDMTGRSESQNAPARSPIASKERPANSELLTQPTEALAQTAPHQPAIDPEARMQAMAELRKQALGCAKCSHLASSRKTVVFGVGDIHSPLIFVGEAPGADEDQRGEPFVGKAGQLLTRIIVAMGLTRESVYIANILKCRPDTPGQVAGNRKPTPEEMETCIPYLHQQIDLIQPKVLVALGGTAIEGLLGKTLGISRLRGQWQTYRNIPLMPTFHPSYLLRPENAPHKRMVWEDMLQVMEKLALPINEKQRRYFLATS